MFQTFVWIWNLIYHLCTAVFVFLKFYCILPLFELQKCINLVHLRQSEPLIRCCGITVLERICAKCWSSIFVVKRCDIIRNFLFFAFLGTDICLCPFSNIHNICIIWNNTYYKKIVAYATWVCFFRERKVNPNAGVSSHWIL